MRCTIIKRSCDFFSIVHRGTLENKIKTNFIRCFNYNIDDRAKWSDYIFSCAWVHNFLKLALIFDYNIFTLQLCRAHTCHSVLQLNSDFNLNSLTECSNWVSNTHSHFSLYIYSPSSAWLHVHDAMIVINKWNDGSQKKTVTWK